jgi:hypothetical protein
MATANLKSVTGESVEIHFSVDPYVRGTNFIATPGSGGARSTKATDIQVSLVVPPDRPLPDHVLFKLQAEPEEGPDREFPVTLEPTGERTYSGRLDRRLIIMSGGHGRIASRQQVVEIVLMRSGHEEDLVDPMNGTPRFQINLELASLAE